ncbi:hypothetical protein AVEN_74261-1 [Araneus ventricosus]|uniref:BTB domain-containing protein n=1 Tax=Araneus ventricosus TaxID=182803 RepID=A0A4Y2RS83_ARAVE|nr:hypothetical protein AVEN_74261-1 [Araneus ventricosus]
MRAKRNSAMICRIVSVRLNGKDAESRNSAMIRRIHTKLVLLVTRSKGMELRSTETLQCPFFKALFCGDFGDGKDVLLKGIDSQTLENILVYLHTGTIHLNEENVTDILVFRPISMTLCCKKQIFFLF